MALRTRPPETSLATREGLGPQGALLCRPRPWSRGPLGGAEQPLFPAVHGGHFGVSAVTCTSRLAPPVLEKGEVLLLPSPATERNEICRRL